MSGYKFSGANPSASNCSANARWNPFLALLLILVPVVILVVVGAAEWFVNWPTMFGIALLLVASLRGPLASSYPVGKKIVKLAISICLLYAARTFFTFATSSLPTTPHFFDKRENWS